MDFSNVITNCNHYKIICLTETWLVPEESNNALFLNNFVIHRNDRNTVNGKTKHGGVRIAVHNSIQHR